MNIIQFNKEELTEIEELLNASNTIHIIYNNLYQLEISGKKDTDEYNKQLDFLKEAIRIENKIYEKINLNFEKCMKIIELLSNTPTTLKTDDISCFIEQKDSDIIVRRIINILITKILTSTDYSKNILSPNVFKELNDMGIPIDSKTIHKNLSKDSKVQAAINNDVIFVFLSILQDDMSLRKNTNYRNQLLKTIYNIIFTYKNIERQILDSNFNIPATVYINSKFLNDLLRANPVIYDFNKSLEINPKVPIYISRLLNIKDADYEHDDKNIASIINQCYIRALLTFMSDDDVYDANEKFHDHIESDSYLQTHPANEISEKAVISCFKSLNRDRAKTRTLSFQNKPQQS